MNARAGKQASFKIRNMTSTDVQSVVGIVGAHCEVDGELADCYYGKYFEDAERVASAREQNVVAVMEGVVVGVGGFSPDKYDWPTVLWLNWLYVLLDHRGHGIGTALMNHVLGQMRGLDIRKVYLDTSSGSSYQSAVRLYERFSFKHEGLLLDYYGEGEHMVIMGLSL